MQGREGSVSVGKFHGDGSLPGRAHSTQEDKLGSGETETGNWELIPASLCGSSATAESYSLPETSHIAHGKTELWPPCLPALQEARSYKHRILQLLRERGYEVKTLTHLP